MNNIINTYQNLPQWG